MKMIRVLMLAFVALAPFCTSVEARWRHGAWGHHGWHGGLSLGLGGFGLRYGDGYYDRGPVLNFGIGYPSYYSYPFGYPYYSRYYDDYPSYYYPRYYRRYYSDYYPGTVIIRK